MEIIRIKLSALWVVLMLTYLLGDVLRIFSGDYIPGEIGGKKVSQVQWLLIGYFNDNSDYNGFYICIAGLSINSLVKHCCCNILFCF